MHELHTPRQAAQWLRGRVTGTLHCDSRKLRAGDGFIAWPGAASDGRRYVPSALAQGATACLVEREGCEAFAFDAPAIAAYARLKSATGPIADCYFDQPSDELAVVAITGTNGKTSTAWWLALALSGLRDAPMPCALVGTLGIGRPPAVQPTGLTTPDPVRLQREFRRFVGEGVKACAIEASSIGIVERRLDGTRVRVAVYTNFTQDHLDYHGSMEAYWQAKAELFAWPGLRAAVVNIDDAQGAALAARLAGGALDLWTVSIGANARLRALDVGYAGGALCFTVAEGDERRPLRTQLIGDYNVSNLLGVIGAMRALGVPLADAVVACGELLPVPGRMERIEQAGQPLLAVDYAHTPDALDKALQALRPLATERGGALWCVFGCGGDRDAGKRPLMGAVASARADRVLVTSDNPRSEAPQAIIAQIVAGRVLSDRLQVQADRAAAIAQAVAAAAPADVILLAGKGHEDTQDIGGVKHPFDDRLQARRALAARAAA